MPHSAGHWELRGAPQRVRLLALRLQEAWPLRRQLERLAELPARPVELRAAAPPASAGREFAAFDALPEFRYPKARSERFPVP